MKKPRFLNLCSFFRKSQRRVGELLRNITRKKASPPAKTPEKIKADKVPRPRKHCTCLRRRRPELPVYGQLRKLAKGNVGFTLPVPSKKKKEDKVALA